ncbi:LytTR family DNA-binding domain-containing protein [Chitinophaga sp. 30R24]|uniref:LytTR family DNA-binding domain-containing protein n=1 Tax=Chitinophaga sp. 30R24 TaxID=3248838 RepID=UPI003B9149AA
MKSLYSLSCSKHAAKHSPFALPMPVINRMAWVAVGSLLGLWLAYNALPLLLLSMCITQFLVRRFSPDCRLAGMAPRWADEVVYLEIAGTEELEGKEYGVTLCDGQDRPMIALPPATLLLVKAEDNYVRIYYHSGNQINKVLVRTTLKKLEDRLSAIGLVRAHRSWLVNIRQVMLLKKGPRGYYLQLNGLEDMVVPVSATYVPSFLSQM